jgi:hypothetical protein
MMTSPHFLISPGTIQRIANLNASLAVTIYKEMTSEAPMESDLARQREITDGR